VSDSISFQDGTFDSYSLTVELDMIKIDCYLLGSPTGGTGTECSHTIKGEKIAEFLAATNISTSNELRERAAKFSAQQWREIHSKIQEFQTDVWVWNETNWDD
jgi:tRNA(Glu) U13 pseudouridine synthase TruD